ncbi:MAG: hypothetical protein ACR2H2_01230 [Solirubrobacteraceae bacterium]
MTVGCGIDDPYQPSAVTSTAMERPSTTPASPHADDATPDFSPAQRRVERSARAFLAGYLAYSYGQAPARGIRAATPALRRELNALPPHLSATGSRAARPRVRQLRVSGLNGSRAYVLAQIDDRSRTYATSLSIERRGHRWLVATVT